MQPLIVILMARVARATSVRRAALPAAAAGLLGWLILGETLSLPQIAGIAMVIASIWFGQPAAGGRRSRCISLTG